MTENDFLREKLSRYSGNFTFLIGNGINLYFQQSLSWNKLLSRIIEKNGLALPRSVLNVLNAKKSQPGLTFPEIASLIEGISKAEDGSRQSLKKAIAACFEGKGSCCALLDYAQRTQKNIITTNYDFTIEDSLGIRRFPRSKEAPVSNKSLYHYLFECFKEENSARVWHIHGHCHSPRSIRITLEDYVNTLKYMETCLFLKNGKHFSPWDGNGWLGESSCLGTFFNKPLVIVGCGLQSEEVLLRGLLLRKLRKVQPSPRSKSPVKNGGLYLSGPSNEDRGKKAFFEAVGIEFVRFQNYVDLYDNPVWAELKK